MEAYDVFEDYNIGYIASFDFLNEISSSAKIYLKNGRFCPIFVYIFLDLLRRFWTFLRNLEGLTEAETFIYACLNKKN